VKPAFSTDEYDFKIVPQYNKLVLEGDVEEFVNEIHFVEKILGKKILIYKKETRQYMAISKYGKEILNELAWLMTKAATDTKLRVIWGVLYIYFRKEIINAQMRRIAFPTDIRDLPTDYLVCIRDLSKVCCIPEQDILNILNNMRIIVSNYISEKKVSFNIHNCFKEFLSYVRRLPSFIHIEIMNLICSSPALLAKDIVEYINQHFGIGKSRVYEVIAELARDGYILRLEAFKTNPPGLAPYLIVPACYVKFARRKYINYLSSKRKFLSKALNGTFKCFFGYRDPKQCVEDRIEDAIEILSRENIIDENQVSIIKNRVREELTKQLGNLIEEPITLPFSFIAIPLSILVNLLRIYKLLKDQPEIYLVRNLFDERLKKEYQISAPRILLRLAEALGLKEKFIEILTELLRIFRDPSDSDEQ